jgi:hypothetical protein
MTANTDHPARNASPTRPGFEHRALVVLMPIGPLAIRTAHRQDASAAVERGGRDRPGLICQGVHRRGHQRLRCPLEVAR